MDFPKAKNSKRSDQLQQRSFAYAAMEKQLVRKHGLWVSLSLVESLPVVRWRSSVPNGALVRK